MGRCEQGPTQVGIAPRGEERRRQGLGGVERAQAQLEAQAGQDGC